MIIVLNYRTFLALCMVVCALNGHKKACKAGFFNATILNPTMKRVGRLKRSGLFFSASQFNFRFVFETQHHFFEFTLLQRAL